MIDWFASKIGLLIFVTTAAAVLLSFFLIFSTNLQLVSDSAVATDVARLIDSSADGSSLVYSVPIQAYTLEINGRILSVNGIERSFVNAANAATISSVHTLLIKKVGGTVYVSAA